MAIGGLTFIFDAVDRVSKVVKGIANETYKLTSTVQVLNEKTGEFEEQAVAFKGAWLSIMFLGMQISKTFKGLTDQITKMYLAAAIADLNLTLAASTGFLFEPLGKAIWGVTQALWELPDPARNAVGAIAAGIPIFGDTLAGAGMLSLGLTGLVGILADMAENVVPGAIAVWGKLGAATMTLKIIIIPFLVKLFLIVAVVVAGIKVLKEAWDSNFMGIRDTTSTVWRLIKPPLTALWELIAFIGVVFWNVFRVVVYGSLAFFLGIIKGVIAIVIGILDGLGVDTEALGKKWEKWWANAGENLKNFRDKVKPFFDKVIEWIEKLTTGAVENFRKFGEAIGKIIDFFNDLRDAAVDLFERSPFGKILDFIKEKAGPLIKTEIGIGERLTKLFTGGLLGFQFGGLVRETGPAMLHRGEYVIPAGGRETGGFTARDIFITSYGPTASDIYAELQSQFRMESVRRRI